MRFLLPQLTTALLSLRALATQVPLPHGAAIAKARPHKVSSSMSNDGLDDNFAGIVDERLNVLNQPLSKVPVGAGPTTGFFRNNFCDASPRDPGCHTVAAILTPSFLKYSASQGNDLRPLFRSLSPQQIENGECRWCICASRWLEALKGSRSHEEGENIVPKVMLEATHHKALKVIDMADLERFAIGGEGNAEGLTDAVGGKVKVKPGR